MTNAQAPKITVLSRPLCEGSVSPELYGGFVELLNDLVPGMWAEMLGNRNFEPAVPMSRWIYHTGEPDFNDIQWNPNNTWSYDTAQPFNGTQCAVLRNSSRVHAAISQSGLAFKRAMRYQFSGYMRNSGGKSTVTLTVRCLLPDGKYMVLARCPITVQGDKWSKYSCEFISKGTTDSAVFQLEAEGVGDVWLDKLSLMPADNVHGWRKDVVHELKELKCAVIRWGGSSVDPGGYKWKNGIGSRDHRTPFVNHPWGRMDSNDVGIDEFLTLCEVVGVKPLVCVSFSDGAQNAADMVEYCNGDAGTYWGAKRAENGHAKPYGVEYWQVGNELGGEPYARGLVDISKAIKQTDPHAKLFGSFPSKEVFDIAGDYIDYICPHFYTSDIPSIDQSIVGLIPWVKDRHIKIAPTEWNVTGGDWGLGRAKLGGLEYALKNGAILNIFQRHADVVTLACRSNMTNSFYSGAIQTNRAGLYKTPSYYVMKLYADHTRPFPLAIGAYPDYIDVSAVASADKKQLTLFAINTKDEPITTELDLADVSAGMTAVSAEMVCDTLDRRQTDVMNHWTAPDVIKTVNLQVSGNTMTLPAYSVSAVECRIK